MWGQGPEVCFPSRLRQVGSFLVPARKSRRPETLAPGECRMGWSFGFYQIIVFPGHGLLGAHTLVVEVPVKATRNLGLQTFHFSGIA